MPENFILPRMNQFETARLKYKPSAIKYLLVAETPPKVCSNRFFYFEEVDKQDSLFLEMSKMLYPAQTQSLSAKQIRADKKHFLEQFKNDGFYLIDALDTPFEQRYSTRQKVPLIAAGQQYLLDKIRGLCEEKTAVVLITAPVFIANNQFLRAQGVNILNKASIDFPGSGGQQKFRDKMSKLLALSF